jgi:hypothetical protein
LLTQPNRLSGYPDGASFTIGYEPASCLSMRL